jgi:membrane peptidoglycan carboxypeptidase
VSDDIRSFRDPRPRDPQPRDPRLRRAAPQWAPGTVTRRTRRRAALNSRRASRRLTGRQRLWATLAGVAAFAFMAVWGGGQVALAVLDTALGGVPPAKPLFADTVVTDRSGQLLAYLHPAGDSRLPVPLDQVSPNVVQATVAIEDKGFWSEGAVDLGRVAAAAWNNLAHHGSQGASTITMQLAKVLYLQDTGGLAYKVHQLLIARHLDGQMSKQQILEAYLNDIYYGHGATGIEAAANIIFGIHAKQLDLAQSALLAGLPNSPTDLDPLRHPDAARARQHEVLQAMVDAGQISKQDAAAAYAEPLQYASGTMDDVNRAPAFVNRVAGALASTLHVDPYRAGLHVTSTLDSNLQSQAQAVVNRQVDAISRLHVTDGALVSMDPRSGDVVAYIGGAGPGHPGSEIDMAASPRQPGSTFKLFTYSTILGERKATELTPVLDAPLTLPKGGPPDGNGPWTVHNYDMRYHGVLPLEEVFANSLNIPAVKVEQLAGTANVVLTARAMGVTTLSDAPSSYGASLTLGAYHIPLWEMAQAGAVLGNSGQLQPARFLLSVKNAAGKELLPPQAAPKQVIDPGVAYIVNDILTNDANRVMEFGPHGDLTLDGHLVSAKTGTTQDFRDNFTVGWTPHLVTAAWVGNADNSPMHGTTGITGAAPIWHQFMTQALRGASDDWPAAPADLHQASYHGRSGWFFAGTDPNTGAKELSGRSNGPDQQGCVTWQSGGGTYWWCGSGGPPGGAGGGGGGGGGGGHGHGHG